MTTNWRGIVCIFFIFSALVATLSGMIVWRDVSVRKISAELQIANMRHEEWQADEFRAFAGRTTDGQKLPDKYRSKK